MKKLDRSLGLVAVCAISISAMLGSGIFVLPGLAAAKVGPGVWIAYLLAGLCVLPAALSKAELATAMPSSGGTYLFLDRTFGPLAGTISGLGLWLSLMLKSSFALVGFGAYLSVLSDLPLRPVALALLGGVITLNVVGAKAVSQIGKVVVVIVLLTLTALCVTASFHHNPELLEPSLPHGTGGLLAGTAFVYVSYAGVTKVAAIAGEVKNPDRNLPFGILISLATVALVYGVTVYMLVSVIPVAQLETDLHPIYTLADHLGGRTWGIAAAILGVVTMTTMAVAGVMAASRFPFAMSKDDLLPQPVAKLSARFATPMNAILLTGVMMALAIWFLEVERIAKLASGFKIIVFTLVNAAVIVLREARPQWYKPGFKSPLYPWVQLGGILLGLVLLVAIGFAALAGTLAIVVPGGILYWFYGRRRTARVGVLAQRAAGRNLQTVSVRPSERDNETPARDASVVVALFGNERSPEMLVDVAAALSLGQHVHAVHLDEVDEQTPFGEPGGDLTTRSLRRRLNTMAREQSVDLDFQAVVSRDLVRTVHNITSAVHCEWLVMRWRGNASRQTLTNLSPIGWLVNHLHSNLAMLRDEGIRYVRRILVLPSPGPNDALVLRTADELALRWNASLTLARYVADDEDEDSLASASGYLEQLAALCDAPVDSLILRGTEQVAAVTQLSAGYDLLVVASSNVRLRNLLFSTDEDRIIAGAHCSVLALKTPRRQIHAALATGPVRSSQKPLGRLLRPIVAQAQLEITRKAALFDYLSDAIAPAVDGVDSKQIRMAFEEREQQENTGVGYGVGLPHAVLANVPELVVAVFTCATPVNYQSPFDEPVDIIIATLGPPDAREDHLRLLSGVARLSVRTSLLPRLRAATSIEELRLAIETSVEELQQHGTSDDSSSLQPR